MNEDFEKLLRSINSGKLNGSKLKLAKKLGISSASISQWINKKSEPSTDNIQKMAKIFSVPEEQIQKIFISNSFSNNQNSFNSTDKENELLRKEIELKNKEIELLKKEMELNNRGR